MIYFLATEDRKSVKIGYSKTSKSVASRIQSLQTGNEQRLDLIGTRYGSQKDEHKIHQSLDHLHIRGEWFRMSSEVSGLIDQWHSFEGMCRDPQFAPTMHGGEYGILRCFKAILVRRCVTRPREFHLKVICPDCDSHSTHGWSARTPPSSIEHRAGDCHYRAEDIDCCFPAHDYPNGYYLTLARSAAHCVNVDFGSDRIEA